MTTGYYPMNKHVAAMLTMLIIPSAFAQTPLTDSKTIVIKPREGANKQ
ncbi:TPA: hypothetical protein ACNP97_003159, partial [Klebsiella pneumoniae]